jgi:hypothetical protein
VALAALTRGQALILIPLAVLVWAPSQQWRAAIGWGMLAAMVAGVALAPWVIRNEQKLGSPVIIATNLGPNVWIGHHPGATGDMRVPGGGGLPQPDHTGLTQPQIEVKADRIALRKGLAYMITHPRDELRLKLRALYASDATALDWNSGYERGYYRSDAVEGRLRRAANSYWYAMLTLASVGLLASWHRMRDSFVVLPMLLLAWSLTHLLFFGDPRFHYPMASVLAILAARAAVIAFETAIRPATVVRRKGYAAA